ncbi:zinc knuckle CX2CX4HX4C containing protein [Tanacetum coccineum]|uniref:Zinc knuckle CX2CX4HX4C containing protein n=1 Tax=Tanacetum coccineum TaxID=301880 RepID=A0ABQ4WK50_9ASTR
MDNQSNASKIRDKTARNLGAGAFGVSCDGSPKASNLSPLISLNATINMPRSLYNVDVAATFGVPLTIVGDLDVLIKYIEGGKHNELLSGMTDDKCMSVMDALGAICDSIQVENSIPSKSKPSDPIIQSMDISTKATSYARVAGASAKDKQKVNYNFRPLMADPIFEGVNISIPHKVVKKVSTHFEHTLYGYFIRKIMVFLVVEYYAKNNWAKHRLKMTMMNTKGFFFFKFNTQAGLEAVLQGGPWMIHNSLIILKKWSMDTRLLKKELTRILIWVKLHDVPIQVFEEDGLSLIAMSLIEVNSKADLVDAVTIGIPSLIGDGFTKETIRVEYKWRPPKCDLCMIFGHVHDHFPKKVVSPPIITTSNVVTPVVEKTNDGFQTTAGTSSKKDNITMSNSYSAFNDEEEDEENMYDESANLFPKTKTSGSSYFTAAIGYLVQLSHLF